MLDVVLRKLRRDAERAREAQHRRIDARESEMLDRFLRALACTPGPGTTVLARVATPAGSVWAGLPTDDLAGIHVACTGASGGGKTMECLSLALQWVRDGGSLTSIDPKGEVSELLATTVPAVTGTPAAVLKPFGTPAPPLRLSTTERGVPREAQALAIARDIASILEEPLSLRQLRVVTKLTELCIELDQQAGDTPLTVLADWLANPQALARAAKRSADRALRRFAASLAGSESQTTLQALAARLDILFLSPAMRAALEAPTCLDFHECYDRGVTLVDLTAPPGCEEAARLLGALLFGRAVRAALGRRVIPLTKPALVVLDEFAQLASKAHQREQLARVLALARFRKLSVLLTFQNPSQLPGPLMDLVHSCCSIQALFRMAPDDARAYASAFPPPPEPVDVTQERAALQRRLCSLERREMALWVKFKGLDPVLVRSPRLDLDALHLGASHVLATHPTEPASMPSPSKPPIERMPEVSALPPLQEERDDDTLNLG
jgi:hypothetical protein